MSEHVGTVHDEGGPAGLSAVVTGKSNAVPWQVLPAGHDRPGFDELGEEVFAQLVPARIVEPVSKADSVWVADDLGIVAASLRTMSRSLGRAGDRDYRGTPPGPASPTRQE